MINLISFRLIPTLHPDAEERAIIIINLDVFRMILRDKNCVPLF